jgi:Amidohydrolase family
LCYGATERNRGRDEATRGLAECRRFIRSNRRTLVRGVVGLHASFTVSDDTIRDAGDLCRELGNVLHVHMAEDRVDVEDAIRRGYRGPLERLEALGALPAGSILAHGVHLDGTQVKRAAALGCWIVQNPRSNRKNRVGYPAALSASERVAVGTDGFASDMREEVMALGKEASAHGEPCSVAGSRAARGRSLVAELWGAPGHPSDDFDLTGTCEMGPDGVTRVSLAGRDLIRNGVLQAGDFDAIQAEAREAAAKLWRRMAAL